MAVMVAVAQYLVLDVSQNRNLAIGSVIGVITTVLSPLIITNYNSWCNLFIPIGTLAWQL